MRQHPYEGERSEPEGEHPAQFNANPRRDLGIERAECDHDVCLVWIVEDLQPHGKGCASIRTRASVASPKGSRTAEGFLRARRERQKDPAGRDLVPPMAMQPPC